MNFLFKNSPRGPPTPCKVSPTAKAYETLVIWPLVSCLYPTVLHPLSFRHTGWPGPGKSQSRFRFWPKHLMKIALGSFRSFLSDTWVRHLSFLLSASHTRKKAPSRQGFLSLIQYKITRAWSSVRHRVCAQDIFVLMSACLTHSALYSLPGEIFAFGVMTVIPLLYLLYLWKIYMK